MADQNDVQGAIGALLDTIIYPSGDGQPSIITPAQVRIVRGWPVKNGLDADVAAGNALISIYPLDGTEGNTTRFPVGVWYDLPTIPATLSWSFSGLTATLNGTISTPQNVAIVCAGGKYGTYAVQSFDTLNSVVASLGAAMTTNGLSVSVAGPTITVSGVSAISPRVGTFSQAIRETKRQRKDFMITHWCASADQRDALVKLVDASLSTNEFLAMPDGTAARFYYHSTKETDATQKEKVWRRDLIYCCEWATTQTITTYQIMVVDQRVYNGNDPTTLITEVIY